MRRWTRIASQAGWGLGDQALSSLTNFALGIYVGRTAGPRALGAFSLAFATYAMMLNVSQALGTEPLVVRHSASSDGEEWGRRTASALSIPVLVGVAAGLGCVFVRSVAGGSLGATFLALGITLPGLLLQDAWRFVFFSRRRPAAAFANDLVWAVLLLAALVALQTTRHATVFWLTLAWGGAASVSACIGIAQSGIWPRPSHVLRWLRGKRDLAPRYLGELTLGASAEPLTFYGIGAVAGLNALGAIRGCQMLLGPLYVCAIGLRLAAMPEAVRLAKNSARGVRDLALLFSVLILLVAFSWTIVVFLIPTRAGVALFHSSWQPSRDVLVPVAVAMAGSGVTGAAVVGLRGLASARLSLRARMIISPIIIAGGIVGALLGEALGAAWGMAIGIWCGVGLSWWYFGKALRRHRFELSEARESLLPVASVPGAAAPSAPEGG